MPRRGSERVVVLEGVAVDKDDEVNPGLGDLIENVAAGSTYSDDRDRMAAEHAVQRRETGTSGIGVPVHKRQLIFNDLEGGAGGRGELRLDAFCRAADDARVGADFRDDPGVAPAFWLE